MSGGAAIAFLTFLGGAFKEGDLATRLGSDATKGFIWAMQLYVVSVTCSVLAHGTTYFSHGAYHFKRDRAGDVFMGCAIVLGLLCLVSFVWGSFAAINAFQHVAKEITRAGG